MIDKRNTSFCRAVDEYAAFQTCRSVLTSLSSLIRATPETEDPVALVQAAARDHLPVNPSDPSSWPTFVVPEPSNRPSVDSVLNEMTTQPWYTEQITERRTTPAKEGQAGEIPPYHRLRCARLDIQAVLNPPLSATISQALTESRKITSLYTHQVAAIHALSEGKNVIVSTSTASGKSVIYQVILLVDTDRSLDNDDFQVPVLQYLEENPSATAIFVYPTKVLTKAVSNTAHITYCLFRPWLKISEQL